MPRTLARAVVLGALLAACGSDPVADEPDLEGVATVRVLAEPPAATTDEPEVSGARTVRFRYVTEWCGERGLDAQPRAVRATYTDDTIAVTLVPRPADCPADARRPVTQGVEVFLDEPVDDRLVSATVGSP